MDGVLGSGAGGIAGILMILLVGLVVGLIARFLMPGPDPAGWVMTIVLGIAGSFVGSLVLGALGLGQAGWIGSILGAMLLLWVHRLMKSRAG